MGLQGSEVQILSSRQQSVACETLDAAFRFVLLTGRHLVTCPPPLNAIRIRSQDRSRKMQVKTSQ